MLALGAFFFPPTIIRQGIVAHFDMTPSGSRYIAGAASAGIYYGSAEEITLNGEISHDLVVAQDFGTRVSRISQQGSIVWSVELESRYNRVFSNGRDLFLLSNFTFNGEPRSEIRRLDFGTGQELGFWPVSFPISGLSISDTHLYVAAMQSFTGLGRVAISSNGNTDLVFEPIQLDKEFSNSRYLLEDGENLILMDTFGHQALVHRISDGTLLASRDFYYPTHVEKIGASEFLVLEEHANRFSEWNSATGAVEILLSCEHPLFNDASISPRSINEDENSTTTLRYFGTTSVCDDRVSDPTLYSPNGFDFSEGLAYIADTDNHRVLAYDVELGRIVGTIRGFNNPSKLVVVENGL